MSCLVSPFALEELARACLVFLGKFFQSLPRSWHELPAALVILFD